MRIGGLASGIDTDSLIKEMMAVQKMPLDKLTQQKTFTEWQQSAMREKNLAFSTLRTSASNLRFQSSFNAYSATSSNPSSATVETTAKAVSGSYSVKVISLATAAKFNSTEAVMKSATEKAKSTDVIGLAGTIKISNGAGETSVPITADMTFEKVAKAIQDATIGGKPELRANFDNTTSRFFISSKEMGADQNFKMTFDGADPAAAKALADKVINNGAVEMTTDTAKYGAIEFDGVKIENLITNKTTVNGLIINMVAASTTASTITVQSNPEKPLEMIKNFVESYNKTIADLEKQLVEKRYPDFKPLSDEQKKDMSDKEIELWEEKARSGLLRNDPLLKKAVQDLRRAFMDEVGEIPDGNFKHLSQIGINTGAYTEGGKLFINEAKLKEALTNKPDEVMNLFVYKNAAGDGVGVGDKVYAKLNEIVSKLSGQAGSLSSSVDNSTISKKIKQMNQEITRWQDKLVRIEDRYWKQFTAMEKAMSQMNSQSTWMQQNMFGGA
ncbi:flagellar filament capping protein FliD [Planococcus shixiaomingii]|uniref:flagellar filament capping protein FliD n=1 Tax=Planococcus shixiaomingii TaxID=3058393 RepID=UPI0026382436|nr:flagellar filament capping protein FliD [Planococcus sp. N022]WKA53930.1 flagellar filament capping protein FliD [Planococcus sp. N022]